MDNVFLVIIMKRGMNMILNFILFFIKIFFALLVLDIVGIGLISLIRHIVVKKINENDKNKGDKK